MSIETDIQRFIMDELILGEKRTEIDSDESLIDSGYLDSIAVLRLVSYIEEKFNVTIEDSELVPDNFETINNMKAFLERKTQQLVIKS